MKIGGTSCRKCSSVIDAAHASPASHWIPAFAGMTGLAGVDGTRGCDGNHLFSYHLVYRELISTVILQQYLRCATVNNQADASTERGRVSGQEEGALSDLFR